LEAEQAKSAVLEEAATTKDPNIIRGSNISRQLDDFWPRLLGQFCKAVACSHQRLKIQYESIISFM
jgi:hypothetical protein